MKISKSRKFFQKLDRSVLLGKRSKIKYYFLQIHFDLQVQNRPKKVKILLLKKCMRNMVSMQKIAKNHQILTSQNWCPFGPRTFSSCFRAILRKSIAKTAKNDQHFTSQKMHVKSGFQC